MSSATSSPAASPQSAGTIPSKVLLLQERSGNLPGGVAMRGSTPGRVLSRRCSIGAASHRDVESEILRQASATEVARAWEGTHAELQERTAEAEEAARLGSKLLDRIAALQAAAAALRADKRRLAQEVGLYRGKAEALARTNDTILAESQRSIDAGQEELRRSEEGRKKAVADRQRAEASAAALKLENDALSQLPEELAAARAALATATETARGLRSDVARLSRLQAESEAAATAAAAAAQKKQAKFLVLARSVAELKCQLTKSAEAAAAEIAAASGREVALRAKLEEERTGRADAADQLARCRREVDRLRGEAAALQRARDEEQEQHQVSLREEADKLRVEQAAAAAEQAAAQARDLAEQRRRCQEEVMRDFFFMVVMSIKVRLQRQILAGDAVDRSAQDLYRSMQARSVPFHAWHTWVREQLGVPEEEGHEAT